MLCQLPYRMITVCLSSVDPLYRFLVWRRPINLIKAGNPQNTLSGYHATTVVCMVPGHLHTRNPRHFTACPRSPLLLQGDHRPQRRPISTLAFYRHPPCRHTPRKKSRARRARLTGREWYCKPLASGGPLALPDAGPRRRNVRREKQSPHEAEHAAAARDRGLFPAA